MTTKVFTKKQFIEYLQEHLPEDECIIPTNVVYGNIEHLSKTKTIRVPLLFPAPSFKAPLRDIQAGLIKPFGFAVCKIDAVDSQVKTLFDLLKNAGQ